MALGQGLLGMNDEEQSRVKAVQRVDRGALGHHINEVERLDAAMGALDGSSGRQGAAGDEKALGQNQQQQEGVTNGLHGTPA